MKSDGESRITCPAPDCNIRLDDENTMDLVEKDVHALYSQKIINAFVDVSVDGWWPIS